MRALIPARKKPRPLPEPLAGTAATNAENPAIDAVDELAVGGDAAAETGDVGDGAGGGWCGVENGGDGAGDIGIRVPNLQRCTRSGWWLRSARHRRPLAPLANPSLLIQDKVTQKALHHRSLGLRQHQDQQCKKVPMRHHPHSAIARMFHLLIQTPNRTHHCHTLETHTRT